MENTQRPWLDASKATDERVRLLLDSMTIEEKLAQMVQLSYSIITSDEADQWARLGAGSFLHIFGDNARRIQRVATQTRLGIPVLFGIDAIRGHAIHNGATVFPTQLALAASWDELLAERVAEATAREVAAEGLHWTFSPVFCLGRDLRWGRIDETFGEDPFLAGQLGAAMIRGYQGKDVGDPERIVACAKHFIAYGESTGGRDSYDSPVSMRSIRSTFLPPFAEAVKAGCLTVMAGYEPIDGLPCSANPDLLKGLLKKELGFEGFVVTDWMNVLNLLKRQKMANDISEASAISLDAGNDMIMTTPEFYSAILALAKSGKVDVSLIDDAVRRILRVKFIAGIFDVPSKVKTLPLAEDPTASDAAQVFGCAAHAKLNLEAARKSIVLLKNRTVGGIPALPIRGTSVTVMTGDLRKMSDRTVRTIAIIGPNADSVRAQFGDWTFFTHPTPRYDATPTFRVATMLEGLSSMAKTEGIKVLYDKGCDIEDLRRESIAKARKLAAKADIVFVAVGDTIWQAGETHDRSNLALTGMQDRLVEDLRKVCDARNIPLVSILVNSKPLDFSRVTEASDAILETFNLGTHGGEAVAEIAFGLTNPQGRLPISFPRTTGQLPVYYNQLPGWHDGKYFDCDSTPLFAFGEGLSYTEYRYDAVRLSRSTAKAGETIEVNVTVTNVGKRIGVETIQVYSADKVASVVTPVRSLRAYRKAQIAPGETLTVSIPLNIDALCVVGIDGLSRVEPGEFDIQAGHDSRDGSLLTAILTVE